ncbi:hypothetical protein ACQUJO_01305 [Ralstonia pseudosolanacearum]
MFDGFWSGILGGLFGSAFMHWLGRYKYLTVFFFVTIGVHVAAFIQDAVDFGVGVALLRAREFTFTSVGIFVPIGIGALSVICLFVYRFGVSSNKN